MSQLPNILRSNINNNRRNQKELSGNVRGDTRTLSPFFAETVCQTLQNLCTDPSISSEARSKLLGILKSMQSEGKSLTPSPQSLSVGSKSQSSAAHSIWLWEKITGRAPLCFAAGPFSIAKHPTRAKNFDIAASLYRSPSIVALRQSRSSALVQDAKSVFSMMNKVMHQTLRYIDSVAELEFDIMEVKEYDNSPMQDMERLFLSVCCSVFSNFAFTTSLKLDITKLVKFLCNIFHYYPQEAHFFSAMHAADSLQMMSLFFREPNINFLFTDEEILFAFLSVLVLDVAHPALHSVSLIEFGHPLVTVFGDVTAKKQSSLLVFLHQLFLDDNFFLSSNLTMQQEVRLRQFVQSSLYDIVTYTASRLRPFLANELLRISAFKRVDEGDIPRLLSTLTVLSSNAFAFRPRKQWLFWGINFCNELRHEENERLRRHMEKLVPELDLEDDASALAMVVDYADIVVKNLAEAVKSLIPTDLYDNFERNVERTVVEAELAAAHISFTLPEISKHWTDNSTVVFEILRKTTAFANSLDRKASKCAILNATSARSNTQSLEPRGSFSLHPSTTGPSRISMCDADSENNQSLSQRVSFGGVNPSRAEHYFSFLRLYNDFEHANRSMEDFSGQLIFLALQLDSSYVGDYARNAFGEDCNASRCAEMALYIRSMEEAPTTAEFISGRPSAFVSSTIVSEDTNKTDGYLLYLLEMYSQRAELIQEAQIEWSMENEGGTGSKTPPRVVTTPTNTLSYRSSPTRLPVDTDSNDITNPSTFLRFPSSSKGKS